MEYKISDLRRFNSIFFEVVRDQKEYNCSMEGDLLVAMNQIPADDMKELSLHLFDLFTVRFPKVKELATRGILEFEDNFNTYYAMYEVTIYKYRKEIIMDFHKFELIDIDTFLDFINESKLV